MTREDRGSRIIRLRAAWPGARRIGRTLVWAGHLGMCAFALLIGGVGFATGLLAWLGDDPGQVYMMSGGIILLLGVAGLVFSKRLVNRTLKDITWFERWR